MDASPGPGVIHISILCPDFINLSILRVFRVRIQIFVTPPMSGFYQSESDRVWRSGKRASPAIMGSLVRSPAPPVFRMRL